jgi:hypothetical protein
MAGKAFILASFAFVLMVNSVDCQGIFYFYENSSPNYLVYNLENPTIETKKEINPTRVETRCLLPNGHYYICSPQRLVTEEPPERPSPPSPDQNEWIHHFLASYPRMGHPETTRFASQ